MMTARANGNWFSVSAASTASATSTKYARPFVCSLGENDPAKVAKVDSKMSWQASQLNSYLLLLALSRQ